MTSAKQPRKSESKGFTVERTFKATVERMWSLWTTKDGVESWWGPEGFTTKVQRLELRPGGAFDYEMTAVGAEQIAALKGMGLPLTSRARSIYLEVTPPRHLVMKAHVDFIPDVAPYDITMTVELRPVRGGTKLVFRSTRMHSAQFQELSRQGQSEQLDKLARLVATSAGRAEGKHPTEMTLMGDREIRISRVFDAPRVRVFQAHVDPRSLEAWWGPRGYATKVQIWEVRPGGRWRIVQHDLDGKEHGFRGAFQEVVPPERLTWTFEYGGTPGHVLTQTTTFEEMPDGKTKLTVRAVYASREDRDAMLASGMEWGMRQSHERLDEFLGGGA